MSRASPERASSAQWAAHVAALALLTLLITPTSAQNFYANIAQINPNAESEQNLWPKTAGGAPVCAPDYHNNGVLYAHRRFWCDGSTFTAESFSSTDVNCTGPAAADNVMDPTDPPIPINGSVPFATRAPNGAVVLIECFDAGNVTLGHFGQTIYNVTDTQCTGTPLGHITTVTGACVSANIPVGQFGTVLSTAVHCGSNATHPGAGAIHLYSTNGCTGDPLLLEEIVGECESVADLRLLADASCVHSSSSVTLDATLNLTSLDGYAVPPASTTSPDVGGSTVGSTSITPGSTTSTVLAVATTTAAATTTRSPTGTSTPSPEANDTTPTATASTLPFTTADLTTASASSTPAPSMAGPEVNGTNVASPGESAASASSLGVSVGVGIGVAAVVVVGLAVWGCRSSRHRTSGRSRKSNPVYERQVDLLDDEDDYDVEVYTRLD